MAVDIGLEAVDRNNYIGPGNTMINKSNPAGASGEITSIEIWAWEGYDISGLRVGTFYTTNGDTLKCRASEAIAGIITSGSKVIKAVSIAVVAGDYIGCYFTGGNMEVSTSGHAGLWYIASENIDPDDEAEYTLLANMGASLGGYIVAVAAGRSFGFIFG